MIHYDLKIIPLTDGRCVLRKTTTSLLCGIKLGKTVSYLYSNYDHNGSGKVKGVGEFTKMEHVMAHCVYDNLDKAKASLTFAVDILKLESNESIIITTDDTLAIEQEAA